MCYCPTPTLHLNLPLTGDCAFLLSPQKTHSVGFISVLKSGDMGQCPHKSPSPCNTYVIPVSLYKFMSSFVTKMRTHTHTSHCSNVWGQSLKKNRCVLLFSKGLFNQRILKKIISFYKNIKQYNCVIIIINVSWAQNQHIRMISEGSCDSKDWNNGC